MRKAVLTIVAPPVAICRFSCAECCAAPIGVFWLTGIIGIIYGFLGGPTNLASPDWSFIGLGLALWGIAAAWTAIAVRGYDEGKCSSAGSTLCSTIKSSCNENASFDEIRKSH